MLINILNPFFVFITLPALGRPKDGSRYARRDVLTYDIVYSPISQPTILGQLELASFSISLLLCYGHDHLLEGKVLCTHRPGDFRLQASANSCSLLVVAADVPKPSCQHIGRDNYIGAPYVQFFHWAIIFHSGNT